MPRTADTILSGIAHVDDASPPYSFGGAAHWVVSPTRRTPVARPRKYPTELREQAVRTYLDSSPRPPVTRLAVQLGVHPDALRYWIKKAAGSLEPDNVLRTPATDDEVMRLRLENTELRRTVALLTAVNNVLADQVDPTVLRM
jgi:transposase